MKPIAEARFLITGGLGFIGAAIARRLLKEGAGQVILFGPPRENFSVSLEGDPLREDGRLKVLTGDIRDEDAVHRAIAGCDYVFHEAGLRVTLCAKEPRLAHEIMVDGTFNVATACVKNRVKKLVLPSSAMVYGEPEYLPLDEDHPTQDTSVYSLCKIKNENLMKSLKQQQGLDYVALRHFNTYGPGMNLSGPEPEVFICWLDRLDAGLPPLIFGDGRQTLDWVYIDDVVEANWRAVSSEVSGETFNVCTGRENSLFEALNLLLSLRGSRLRPEFREKRAVAHFSRRVGSTEKAAAQLGFHAQVSLGKGLRKLMAWREQVLNEKRRAGMASPL